MTNLKTNCEATFPIAEIHSSHDHEIRHHKIAIFESYVNETNGASKGLKKMPFQQMSGINSKKINYNIHLEKLISALHVAGFHSGPLSRLDWNLEMLVFQEEGKHEDLEKNAKS